MSESRTAVVDLTYRCNSPCRYCRWGNPSTPGRQDLPLENVLLPSETLRVLGTQRVVFSGGEPLLHRGLDDILAYYRQHVPARVVITNGLLLNSERRRRLVDAGATGFTFSIDSVSPERYFASRGWDAPQLERVLKNLCDASRSQDAEGFRVEVNSVVTRATACWESVGELLDFASSLNIRQVKFQPLFNDGFVSRSAPWLALDSRSVADLEKIADKIASCTEIATNPPAFWNDLAALAAGRQLNPVRCALGEGTVLVVQGRIARCYWVPEADIGHVSGRVNADPTRESVHRLTEAKPRCHVDARCFCLQPLTHQWSEPIQIPCARSM